jgi:protein-L-isoaspartate(D-aspartate) O-methyltransferase
MKDKYQSEREKMVEDQIRARGISDTKVLAAMATVAREKFVSPSQKNYAYKDGPLSIGMGQTISQPYIVAYMTELLELDGEEKVLELGTGSGYQTAILAEIVSWVYTIEVIESLGLRARDLLQTELYYKNISFKVGNGREGWQEYGPFDRILITAAPGKFPKNLFLQLKDNGIAVAPVGDYFQRIIRYRKKKGKIKEEALIGVSFVPFI